MCDTANQSDVRSGETYGRNLQGLAGINSQPSGGFTLLQTLKGEVILHRGRLNTAEKLVLWLERNPDAEPMIALLRSRACDGSSLRGV